MTLDLELSNKRIWKCDQCGRRSAWQDGWTVYGSIAMEEVLGAAEMPTLCSDACRQAFEAKMKSGEIEVPTVKLRGPNGFKITGERKGY